MTSTLTRIDFETADRDEASDAIHGAYGFRARLRGREIVFRQQSVFGSDVSFTELRFGADLATDSEPNRNVVVSEVPRGRFVAHRGRDVTDLSDGGLFLLPTGSTTRVELHHTITRTYSLGSVERLRAVTREALPDAPDLDLTRLRPESPAAERYLRDTLGLHRRHFLSGSSPTNGLAADQALRHLLLTTAAVFGLATPKIGSVGESAIVRRARAHIDEHLRDPITAAELAQAAGTSVRSLQIAFRREIGQTPLEHVREVRLVAARAELLSGPETEGGTLPTVAAVSHRWGFLNPGRFSSLYRRRFGEYPSDTLRRR
ncbi:helix-turn-helix transcriptional regulator [Herbiconiux sp.]|uniref:helix-turn-helix transcriptional regulator n=1 Tax=Herbiconiux sp. TaxID=1871186 RepID=UPI0025C704CB|nr:helix-turn-helix transcriptional regulator [Herbiconiux sp.]